MNLFVCVVRGEASKVYLIGEVDEFVCLCC